MKSISWFAVPTRRKAATVGVTALAVVSMSVTGCTTSTSDAPTHVPPTIASTTVATTPKTVAAPSVTSSSAAPTAAPASSYTPPPDPNKKGVRLTVANGDFGHNERVWIEATPLGDPAAPFHDGYRPANAVAFKMHIYTDPENDGTAWVGTDLNLALEPSHGGTSFTASGHDRSYRDNNTLITKLCHGLPMLDQASRERDATIMGGYTLPPDDWFTGCIVFDYFGTARPTTLSYQDHDDGIARQTIWTGHVGTGGAQRVKPETLASWSGDGSELLHVSKNVRKGDALRLCWTFTGEGNHILEGESNTAGSDLDIYTNTVGPRDHGCRGVMGTLEPYLQVLAEAGWRVEVAGHQTG